MTGPQQRSVARAAVKILGLFQGYLSDQFEEDELTSELFRGVMRVLVPLLPSFEAVHKRLRKTNNRSKAALLLLGLHIGHRLDTRLGEVMPRTVPSIRPDGTLNLCVTIDGDIEAIPPLELRDSIRSMATVLAKGVPFYLDTTELDYRVKTASG